MAVRKTVPRESRLSKAELVEVDGVVFWDVPDLSSFEDIPTRREIRGDGDRLDIVAYEKLGSEQLWWVVAYANGVRLAPCEYRPQEAVEIPSAIDVDARLGGE